MEHNIKKTKKTWKYRNLVVLVPGGLSQLLELLCVLASHANVFLFSFERRRVHVIDNVLILRVDVASERVECIDCCFTRRWRVCLQQWRRLRHNHTTTTTVIVGLVTTIQLPKLKLPCLDLSHMHAGCDWDWVRSYTHSTQNRSFRKRSSQPMSWLGMD